MRHGLVWVSFAALAGCISAPQEQVVQVAPPVASPAVPAESRSAAGRRIAYDGVGNFILPDGSVVPSDGTGGFTLPNGAYVASDPAGGVTLPNGIRCTSDGAGGYLCP